MKEDTRKLNIMKDKAEDRKKVFHVTSNSRSEKLGTLNKNEDEGENTECNSTLRTSV